MDISLSVGFIHPGGYIIFSLLALTWEIPLVSLNIRTDLPDEIHGLLEFIDDLGDHWIECGLLLVAQVFRVILLKLCEFWLG